MTNPQALDPRHTAAVIIAPLDFFLDAMVQRDEHVKAWRWHWFVRGIDIRRDGRRYSARGELLS